MQNEAASLYFKDARSDKEYHLQLEAKGEGYVVNYQNGPRGGTLASGTRTEVPVAYAVAKKKFDSVVKEKTGKGYTASTEGKAFVGSSLEARAAPVGLQLLNPIADSKLEAYLRDPDYVAQEKHDGHRRAVTRKDASVVGINRKELVTGLPVEVHSVLNATLTADDITDGELMGSVYVMFDVLHYKGVDTRSKTVEQRLALLSDIERSLEGKGSAVTVTKTARTEAEKRALFTWLKVNKREGIVFKKLDSAYETGRPASGGPQVKFKFRHSATFIVSKIGATKRSITVATLDPTTQDLVLFGDCGVPKNQAMPQIGDLVEVTYRLVFQTGGLSEPLYAGTRDDIERSSCTTAQLVYKPTDCGESESADEE